MAAFTVLLGTSASMSGDGLARLRTLVIATEARWRTLGAYEEARYVYHLQRLRSHFIQAQSETEDEETIKTSPTPD